MLSPLLRPDASDLPSFAKRILMRNGPSCEPFPRFRILSGVQKRRVL